jgi:zinc/manganese transport system substrate-binding protein
VVVASDGITTLIRTAAPEHEKRSSSRDADARVNPHAWQSVANVKIYAQNVRNALIAADPTHRVAYEASTATYLTKLDMLDAEIRAIVAGIPAERRRVMTTHEAFAYFAEAYGVEMVGLQGPAPAAEPSAKDMAALISQIREQRIAAVFMESVVDPRVLARIANDTGVKVGGTLYSDALTGPGGPAPTYIELMRHNVRVLGSALTGG